MERLLLLPQVDKRETSLLQIEAGRRQTHHVHTHISHPMATCVHALSPPSGGGPGSAMSRIVSRDATRLKLLLGTLRRSGMLVCCASFCVGTAPPAVASSWSSRSGAAWWMASTSSFSFSRSPSDDVCVRVS